MADKKHYQIKNIKKTGATYRVVYGQRGQGKTINDVVTIVKLYTERMRVKRPDLYEKLIEAKTLNEFESISNEFLNWEMENGR